MEISLADAERVIAAARRRADDLRVIVSIVVVDPRGDLKAAVRGDGAQWRTTKIALGKAFAAAAHGVPSADLAARADSPVMRALMAMENGLIIPAPGGVPLRRGDLLLGAVGVSGAPTAELDVAIAEAGAGAFA